MMNETDRLVSGRYEFRCWPDDDGDIAATIRKKYRRENIEDREDIYFLSEQQPSLSSKLRAGCRFEIKQRTAVDPPLEYWRVAVESEFPLGDETISDIKDLFQWTRDFPASLFSSPERLMEVFAPHVDTIAVGKHRELFEAGTCRIEITSVSHKQKTSQTIAAESPDRTSIERILADIGISHLPNIHYGARLIAMRDT